MLNEIWKSIIHFEELYEISNYGRVRRIKPYNNSEINRVLRPRKTHGGYLHVNLSKNSKTINKYIHRLVLESFVGIESFRSQVNHIDGNKNNNRLNNLQWCTPSENMKHSFLIGLHTRGKAGNTKLNSIAVKVIRFLYHKNYLKKHLALAYKINIQTINDIISYRTWKHI